MDLDGQIHVPGFFIGERSAICHNRIGLPLLRLHVDIEIPAIREGFTGIGEDAVGTDSVRHRG